MRAALDEQNKKARAEGAPEVPTEAVVAMAEELLPAARLADWLDRADAALASAEEIDVRDLRSVVVSAADVARDERIRESTGALKEVLDRRSAAEQEEWLTELRSALDSGSVVWALRLSSRASGLGASVPDDLADRLSDDAGKALAADAPSDRWAAVLDAVAYSPVRQRVVPAGAPPDPAEELLAAVRKHAGRVPALRPLFGVDAPPPKAPARSAHARPPRSRPATPPPDLRPPPLPRPPLPPGMRRIPPPPPRPPGGTPPLRHEPGPEAPPAPTAAPDPAAPSPSSEPHEPGPEAPPAPTAAPDPAAPSPSSEPQEPGPEAPPS